MKRSAALLRVLRLRESVARVEDDHARQMLAGEVDGLDGLRSQQDALDAQRAQRAQAERLDIGLARALEDIDGALGDAQCAARAAVAQAEQARSATAEALLAASRGVERATFRRDAFDRLQERTRELRQADDRTRRRP